MNKDYRIDALQFAFWSEEVFLQMRKGKVDAVHATIAYHGNFRETVNELTQWNRLFRKYSKYIIPGKTAEDIAEAAKTDRTAIFFGFQNPSPIEEDLSLLEVWSALGVRFIQPSYNNQSLLATGYTEEFDTGITNMGREAIREMNRLGIVIDMSHSGERSTLEAVELSERPVAVTHANPQFWHPIQRNKSDKVIKALAESGGMLGLSLYPLHLKDGSKCTLKSFCEMTAKLAEMIGTDHIGIGSDLCQNRPGKDLDWMRNGKWTLYGKNGGSFPDPPEWFKDNTCFDRLESGLMEAGFDKSETGKILGNNWYRFWESSFKSTELSNTQ